MLIIRVKAHLLLIVGNKIVTKKRRNRFVVGFMCKGNKSPLTIKVKLAKRRILFFFSPVLYCFNIINQPFSLVGVPCCGCFPA